MKKFLIVVLSIFLFPFSVFANDDYESQKISYPNFTGELLTEYTVDVLSDKKKANNDDKSVDSKLNMEALFKFNLNQFFSVNTKWTFRPVEKRVFTGDRNNYDSRYNFDGDGYIMGRPYSDDYYGKEGYISREFHWDDYGLIVEELTLDFRNNDLAFGIGKMSPTFGRAFDKTRFYGVYGTVIPEEYELTEKFGMYASIILDEYAEIRFNTFFDDDTSLSDSIFRSRRKDKSKGGAGNTNSLRNYSITIDGAFGDFAYNAGFRYLDTKGAGYYDDQEKGYVFGLEHLTEFNDGEIRFIPSFEFAFFENFDGMKNRDVFYSTVSIPLIYKGWSFLVSNSLKYDDEKYYKDYWSYLTQVAIGYRFSSGLMIDAAKKWHKEVTKLSDPSLPLVSSGQAKDIRRYDSWAIMVSYLYKF